MTRFSIALLLLATACTTEPFDAIEPPLTGDAGMAGAWDEAFQAPATSGLDLSILASADAPSVVRYDGDLVEELPDGPPGRPWLELIDYPDWEEPEVRAHGFPAISADRLTLVWIDGDADFESQTVVFAHAHDGRPLESLDLLDLRSAAFARFVGLLEDGDYETLTDLRYEEVWDEGQYQRRFHGRGLLITQEVEGRLVQLLERDTGEAMATLTLGSAEVTDAGDGTGIGEDLFAAFVAPDRSFVLLETGACGCWCWIEPHVTYVSLHGSGSPD